MCEHSSRQGLFPFVHGIQQWRMACRTLTLLCSQRFQAQKEQSRSLRWPGHVQERTRARRDGHNMQGEKIQAQKHECGQLLDGAVLCKLMQ